MKMNAKFFSRPYSFVKHALCAAALTLPLSAFAENLSYRYVDLAHFPKAEINAGNFDVDGDGLQLRGSLPVYENFFALAELQDLDLESNVDAARWLIGAGGHWPLNNNLDLIARVGFVHYDVDFGTTDDDDTGLFAGVRLRTFIAPKIEVEGGFEHTQVDVRGLDSDTYFIGEGRYNFTPQWSAGLIITLGGDTSVFGAQGRYSF